MTKPVSRKVAAQEAERVATPPTQTLPARVRARDIATVVERLGLIEDWLALGLSPRQAATRAMKPDTGDGKGGFGITRSYAERFVGAALKRLHRDATGEPVESKRARSIAFWQGQMQRALNATRTFAQNGEAISYPCPDLKAANQARAALDAIEGVTTGAHALATPRRDGE